jgi:Fe-S-cluster-containing hydrogenase component 2
MICSLNATGSIISPAKARIRVVKREILGVDLPLVCKQCEDPPCKNVCPVNAIGVDFNTGAIIVFDNRCIGCRECMLACPFGAINFDVMKRVCTICDLCKGDPQCVNICPYQAIRYIKSDVAASLRRSKALERFQEATFKAWNTL